MPLTMTRSIQLELAIDDGQRSQPLGTVAVPRRRSLRTRTPLRLAAPADPRRVRSAPRHRLAQARACGECGGPLVAGEGKQTCVLCGTSRPRSI